MTFPIMFIIVALPFLGVGAGLAIDAVYPSKPPREHALQVKPSSGQHNAIATDCVLTGSVETCRR